MTPQESEQSVALVVDKCPHCGKPVKPPLPEPGQIPEPQATGSSGATPTDSLAPEVVECVKCHERLRLNAAERRSWEYDCPFCREMFKIPRPVQTSPARPPAPAAAPSPPAAMSPPSVAPPAQAVGPSPPPTPSLPQTKTPSPPVPVAVPPAAPPTQPAALSPPAAAPRPQVTVSPARAPAPTPRLAAPSSPVAARSLPAAAPSLIQGYYYQKNGKECGPASADDLWHMVAGDELDEDSLVRSVSSDRWIPFGELPDSAFSGAFQQAIHEFHVAHHPSIPPFRAPLPPPRRPATGKTVKVFAVLLVLAGLLFAAVTVSEYAAGPYRWRTWLRGGLERLSPSLGRLGTQLGIASKGNDCEAVGGQHAWHHIDEKTTGCYHCKVTRSVQSPDTKTTETATGASP